jgi:anti-sigma factor RsiW
MNWEDQLKLQALLDGELPPDEARALSDFVERDPAAAALLAQLRTTRQILRSGEAPCTMTEPREFYWSKIARDIERHERRSRDRQPSGLLAWLRLLVLPAAVVVVLVIVSISLHNHARTASPVATGNQPAPPAEPKLAGADTTNTILGR